MFQEFISKTPEPGKCQCADAGSDRCYRKHQQELRDTAYPETPYVRPMSRIQKMRALVECGECANAAEARAFLEDMGE
jgi:hypothetical protein